MEIVQEQRYVCKICSKSCVSGKSLGGHMRVHLALIAASKKAAKSKAEIKAEFEEVSDHDYNPQLKEISINNQSNSEEEKISSPDIEDGDQSINYGLRENPKKSWRISSNHPKQGAASKASPPSCKECGKEFLTLRALSGHMRCHSIKNKKANQCKKCCRGFDSIRAMFGHMKSHTKRPRDEDESADQSLSELENLCPIRRKRSSIRYKNVTSNASTSAVSNELEDLQEAALCLIMLSRGEMADWLKFDSINESSDDHSHYFGGESSSCKNEKLFCGNYDGDFVYDDKKMKGISGNCSFGYENAYTGDLDCTFVNGEGIMRVDFETVDDMMKANNVHEEMENGQLNEFALMRPYCARISDSAKTSKDLDKDLSVVTSKNKSSSENEVYLEIGKGFEKKPEYRCKTLHPHMAVKALNSRQGDDSSEVCVKTHTLECGGEQECLETCKGKKFDCPICFKVFRSGQALGGHKRAHFNETKNQESIAVIQRRAGHIDHGSFDLNFPVSTVDNSEDTTKTEVGRNLWWVGAY